MKPISGSVRDPIPYGIVASVFLAVAILAAMGLRAPLKFVPLLLFQLVCKSAWCAALARPLLVAGGFPASHTATVVLFVLAMVGHMIAIPFRCVFAKEAGAWRQTDFLAGAHQAAWESASGGSESQHVDSRQRP